MSSTSIRCGLIGFGKMGQIRAEAIAHSGCGHITRVFDPACADFQGLSPAASAQAIIDDPAIDTIFICTPNFQNRPLTVAALQAGKHVFCEKPPAFTAAEVEGIQAVEKASGRKLMYGFNHRHHDSVKKMKSIVMEGQYGSLLWMRGRYGKSVDHNYFNTWRAKKELAGGGILLDQGVHMVDLFLHLGGDFDEVQAMVSSLYWNLPGIEDNVFANFRNRATGVVASLHSTMTQWRHLFSLEVFMERGYMVLNGLKTQSGSYGEEILTIAKNRSVAPAASWQDEEKDVYRVDNSWNAEVSYFMNSIVNDTPIENGNSADALKVMRIIDTVYQNEHVNQPNLHEKLQPGLK